MTYATTSLIVDGAIEEEQTYYDKALLREYVASLKEEMRGDGVNADLFVIWHEHDPSTDECQCVQYLQDHKPYAEFHFNPANSEEN